MNVYDAQLVNDGRILHHLGLMLQRDEHNVARPVSSFFSAAPTNATTGNIPLTRCAWCEAEEKQKFGKQKAEKGISHGICERHAAAMRAEIELMHSERRAA